MVEKRSSGESSKRLGDLLSWIFPVVPERSPGEAYTLEVLSGRLPSAVYDAFPTCDPRRILAPLKEIEEEERRITEGRNGAFDRIAGEIVGRTPAASREVLIQLTTVPIALYRWARTRARELDDVRERVVALEKRLRGILNALNARPELTPATTAAAAVEIECILQYLRWIPSSAREIEKWLGTQGLRRGRKDLAKLHVWTDRGCKLSEHLDKLRIEQNYSAERETIPAGFGDEYAVELLYARYRKVLPPDFKLQLRRRINRS